MAKDELLLKLKSGFGRVVGPRKRGQDESKEARARQAKDEADEGSLSAELQGLIDAAIASCRQEIAALEDDLRVRTNELETERRRADDALEKLNRSQTQEADQTQIQAQADEIAKLRSRIDSLSAAEKGRKEAVVQLEASQKQMRDREAENKKLSAEIASLQKQLKMALVAAQGQDKIAAELKKVQKRAADAQVALEKARAIHQQQDEAIKKAETELAALRDSASVHDGRIDELEKSLTESTHLLRVKTLEQEAALQRETDMQATVEALQQALQDNTAALRDRDREIALLQDCVEACKSMALLDQQDHEDMTHRLDLLLSGSRDAAEQDGQPSQTALEERIKTLEAALAERFEEIAALTRMLPGHDASLENAPEAVVQDKPRSTEPRAGRSNQRQREYDIISQSGLFDHEWYLTQNPEVAKAGIDPLDHYLETGGREGRDPSPRFNTAYYYEINKEARQQGINPLLHFLDLGQSGTEQQPMISRRQRLRPQETK